MRMFSRIISLILSIFFFDIFPNECMDLTSQIGSGGVIGSSRISSAPNAIGGRLSSGAKPQNGNLKASSISFRHKFPNGQNLIASSHQNASNLLPKGHKGVKLPMATAKNAELIGHSSEENDKLVEKLTQIYEKIVSKMEDGWMRDEVFLDDEAKWKEAVRKVANLLALSNTEPAAFIENKNNLNNVIPNFICLLAYVKTVAIQQHIGTITIEICIMEDLIEQCRQRLQRKQDGERKEPNSKGNGLEEVEKMSNLANGPIKLNSDEVECILSHADLDLLKRSFLGVLGIHDDGNGKDLGNKNWIEYVVKTRIQKLKEELQNGKPFLNSIQPPTNSDDVNEGKVHLAKEELARTNQWLDRLQFLLISFDYFRGWAQPSPRMPTIVKKVDTKNMPT